MNAGRPEGVEIDVWAEMNGRQRLRPAAAIIELGGLVHDFRDNWKIAAPQI